MSSSGCEVELCLGGRGTSIPFFACVQDPLMCGLRAPRNENRVLIDTGSSARIFTQLRLTSPVKEHVATSLRAQLPVVEDGILLQMICRRLEVSPLLCKSKHKMYAVGIRVVSWDKF